MKKELIRKQKNQIGLSDIVLYKKNGTYYIKDDYGIKKASAQLVMLIEKKKASDLNRDAFFFHG